MRVATPLQLVTSALVITVLVPSPMAAGSPPSPVQPPGVARFVDLPVGAATSVTTVAGGAWVRSFGTSADDDLSMIRHAGDGGYVFGGATGNASANDPTTVPVLIP